MSMKFTPSSAARRRTRTHSSRSAGGPHTPLPTMRIAPKPRRLTVRSPPKVNVPDAWATDVGHAYDRTPRGRVRILAWQAERVDLAALEELPLTYSEVGATAAAELPAGYDHQHVERQIGTGDQRFEQAADAVMHWGMQRGSGLRVQASSEVVVVDAIVVVRMGFLPAPCRVVYVIDEPDIRGFGYGTLPGHPECGEERFVVRRDPATSAVFAEVTAFSRPAAWWSKAGGPVVRVGPARHRPALPARGLTRYEPQPVNSFSAPAHICSMTSPTDASSWIMPTD